MGSSAYVIADEPAPSPFQHLVVNPIWPLFAIMFGGAWLSLPWFAFNGFAMGSPTRRKELLTVVSTFSLAGVWYLLSIAYLDGTDGHGRAAVQCVLLGGTAIKLGGAYWLHILQSRTFDLFQYFGGKPKNGVIVVIAAFWLSDGILAALRPLPDVLFLALR